MTIKELEERTGMTRDNIRYYEQEGLLAPARKENGYRSYSEEDCEDLLKIKLLRQLQFSLQEIRDLQDGTLSLTQAMEGRSALLERESSELLSARDVCRTIEREVPDYAALDPQVYLRQLSAPRDTAAADVAQPHPWRRYFARSLDLTLAGLAVSLVRFCVFRQTVDSGGAGARIVQLILSWTVLMLAEPLLLHFWGTTVGKRLFGIRVVSIRTGEKLGLSEAFSRTGMVFACGDGASIPLVNIGCNIYSYYRYAVKGEPLAWEEDNTEQFSDMTWRAPVGYVLAVAAVVGVTYLAGISTLLPPNRGDLTVAEFAENYNYYRDHFEIDPRFSLDRDGKWEKAEDTGFVVISIGGELPQPDYVFTTEDGVITQVSWSYTLEEEAVYLDSVSPQLCYLSLAAAQRGTHVWDLKNDGLLMEGWDVNAEHFSCSWQGVTLDYRTQLLRDADGWHLRPGSTVSCTVTVEH